MVNLLDQKIKHVSINAMYLQKKEQLLIQNTKTFCV
jgi:hypothetical protein